MPDAASDQQPRASGALYAVITALLLALAGPLGLIPLWLGPWTRRFKVAMTVLWFVIYSPAVWFYLSQMYHR